MAVVTEAMRTQVTENYVALFGRAPDAEGLAYWVQQMAGGTTIQQIAQDMYNTEPARSYYPAYLTPTEIVTSFYVNVLGRAPDAEGLAYWTGRLLATDGGTTIREMIDAVINYSGTDPVALDAKALFENKVNVAEYYAVVNQGGIEYASVVLDGITPDTDTSTPEAIEAIIQANVPATGAVFTLTTGQDTIVGTSGNDTINAYVNYDVNYGQTLNSGDTIEGGQGNDTLRVTVDYESDTDLNVNMSGVERVEIRDFDGQTFYAQGVTDVHTISNEGGASVYTYWDNASYIVPNIEFHNGWNYFEQDAGVVNQIDMLNVLVDNSNAEVYTYSDNTAFSGRGNYLNAMITSTGEGWNAGQNYLYLGESRAASTVTVKGTTNLELEIEHWDDNAGNASIASIDASQLAAGLEMDVEFAGDGTVVGGTGNDSLTDDSDDNDLEISYTTGDGKDMVDVSSGGATNVYHVDTGAGDDKIVAGGMITEDNTYDGGAGTDTLAINAAAVMYVNGLDAALQDKVTGNIHSIEVLEITNGLNAAPDTDLDMSIFGDIPAVVLDASSVTTISNIVDEFSLTLKGAANDVTLELADDTASDTVNLTLSSAAALAAGTVTAADVETVNITTKDTNTTEHQDSLTLVATSAETVTVTGNAGLNLTNTGNTEITTFDASGVTKGDVVFASANDDTKSVVMIKGGAGDDTLTGNVGADTIEGNGGDDTIAGGDGKDTLAGGAGDDLLLGEAGADTISGGDGDDNIMGGAGLDQLNGGAGADTFWFTGPSTDSNGVNVDVIADFLSGTDFIKTAALVDYAGEANGYGAVLTSLTGVAYQAVLDISTSDLYIDVNGDKILNDADIAIHLTGVTELTQDDFVA